jgi:ankyrin repeat protein
MMNFDGQKPPDPDSLMEAGAGEGSQCSLSGQDPIRVLLAGGADAGAADQAGRTPLMILAEKGDMPAVQALLSMGSGVAVNSVDGEGATALTLAAAERHLGVVEELLNHGAAPSGQRKEGLGLWDKASTPKNPAMTEACRAPVSRGAEEVILGKLLIALYKKGGDPNEKDEDGKTPLHHLAAHPSPPAGLLGLVLGIGADPNQEDAEGDTALLLVAKSRAARRRVGN